MLNMHLSYKPTSSWRIFFWYGERPRQFSFMKNFRALVVPGGGCRKWILLHFGQLSSGLPLKGQLWLRRKGCVTGDSVHAPIKINSTCVHMVRLSIYKTRRPEHPHSPIRRYERHPQGPPLFGPVTIWRKWFPSQKNILVLFGKIGCPRDIIGFGGWGIKIFNLKSLGGVIPIFFNNFSII